MYLALIVHEDLTVTNLESFLCLGIKAEIECISKICDIYIMENLVDIAEQELAKLVELQRQRDELVSLAQEHDNPSLVKPDESPNGNVQTLVFNDGEIVSTKGGWAFMRRSMFTLKSRVVDHQRSVAFPNPYGGDGMSYAIVKDLKTAGMIREAIRTTFL